MIHPGSQEGGTPLAEAVERVTRCANYSEDEVSVVPRADLRLILTTLSSQGEALDALAGALEPFVLLAQDWRIDGTFWSDEKVLTSFHTPITIGQIRQARTSLDLYRKMKDDRR